MKKKLVDFRNEIKSEDVKNGQIVVDENGNFHMKIRNKFVHIIIKQQYQNCAGAIDKVYDGKTGDCLIKRLVVENDSN